MRLAYSGAQHRTGGATLTEETGVEKTPGRSLVGVAGAALMAVALTLFIVQNTNSTPVSWLWIDGSAPLWVVIFGAALAGAVLSEALGWIMRRARRRH